MNVMCCREESGKKSKTEDSTTPATNGGTDQTAVAGQGQHDPNAWGNYNQGWGGYNMQQVRLLIVPGNDMMI